MGFLRGNKAKKAGAGCQPQPAQKAKPADEDAKLADERAQNLARMLQIYMRDDKK